ncbi:hypothetical protein JQ561_13395 [Bradyrhizobium diazoefficiens]|uniref:hypothetical protein n=1 Tax=Bradyrhizobium sp. WYCCWR 12699 TaxID=3064203 RepID=UPI001BACECAC|nr:MULTISPECIES: hypothetical protein [Bradyrhizobium]MBR0927603.1 hypothetical protein [Bradyrhizobium diazoefficiens]MDT4741073.1 hypothetical protein [Bradyrhizobium sp. WYCCWR 12699]
MIELTSNFAIEFSRVRQGDHNEFAMCTSAPGAAIGAACVDRENTSARPADSRQRQPDGLAVRPVSGGLARIGLTGRISQE